MMLILFKKCHMLWYVIFSSGVAEFVVERIKCGKKKSKYDTTFARNNTHESNLTAP